MCELIEHVLSFIVLTKLEFIVNNSSRESWHFLDSAIIGLAIRAHFDLLALSYNSLKECNPSLRIFLGSHLLDVLHLLTRYQENIAAGLADALEDVHSVLEVAHVKHGQLKFQIAEVPWAVG